MANLQTFHSHCLKQIRSTPHIGILCFIIFAAAVLRLWQLNTHGIFFGDAAHDVLSAHQALHERTIPLLGIESSVPRFRQGPVAVWINMVGLAVFDNSVFAVAVIYATLSILAVVALYEVTTLTINQKTGLAASAILAVSPLAIAHGRMPYHITPIPLALVFFLWSLHCVLHKKKWSILAASFMWGVLFQFELALTPLVLLLPLTLWRSNQHTSRAAWLQVAGGAGLALLPQLLFDLTHSFAHLGGFAVWMGYRIGSFSLGGSHHFSLSTVQTVASTFSTYIGRIWLFNATPLALLGVALWFGVLLTLTKKFLKPITKKNVVPEFIVLALGASWLLIVSYLVHGAPSEAYMPPFLILVPLLLAYWWQTLPSPKAQLLLISWVCITLLNITQMAHFNWFVSSTHPFSYGPGTGEQRAVLALAEERYPDYTVATTDPGGTFANYLDNYRWWVLADQLTLNIENRGDTMLFIDTVPSELDAYPNTNSVIFETVQLMKIYE